MIFKIKGRLGLNFLKKIAMLWPEEKAKARLSGGPGHAWRNFKRVSCQLDDREDKGRESHSGYEVDGGRELADAVLESRDRGFELFDP